MEAPPGPRGAFSQSPAGVPSDGPTRGSKNLRRRECARGVVSGLSEDIQKCDRPPAPAPDPAVAMKGEPKIPPHSYGEPKNYVTCVSKVVMLNRMQTHPLRPRLPAINHPDRKRACDETRAESSPGKNRSPALSPPSASLADKGGDAVGSVVGSRHGRQLARVARKPCGWSGRGQFGFGGRSAE